MRTLIGLAAGCILAVVGTFAFLAMFPQAHSYSFVVALAALGLAVGIAQGARSIQRAAGWLSMLDGLACLAAGTLIWLPGRGHALGGVGLAGGVAILFLLTFGSILLLGTLFLRER